MYAADLLACMTVFMPHGSCCLGHPVGTAACSSAAPCMCQGMAQLLRGFLHMTMSCMQACLIMRTVSLRSIYVSLYRLAWSVVC
jgi:hypothetical protein